MPNTLQSRVNTEAKSCQEITWTNSTIQDPEFKSQFPNKTQGENFVEHCLESLSSLYSSTQGSARALSPPVLVPYRSTDYSRTALTGSARCSQSSCPRPLVYRLLTDYSQVLHVLSVLLSSSPGLPTTHGLLTGSARALSPPVLVPWSTDYSRTTHRFCTCSQSSCPRPLVYRLLTDYSQVLHVLSVLLSSSPGLPTTHGLLTGSARCSQSSCPRPLYRSTDYSRTTHRFCTCSQSSCPRPLVYRLLTDYSQVLHVLSASSVLLYRLSRTTHRFCTCSQSSCPRPLVYRLSRTALTGSARPLVYRSQSSCPRPSTGLPTTHGLLTGSARALSPPVLVPLPVYRLSRTALTGVSLSRKPFKSLLIYSRFCTCSQSSCPRPLVYRLLTDYSQVLHVLSVLLSSSLYRSTDYSRTTHRFCTCSQSSCPRPLVYRLLTDYSQVLHVLSVLLSSSPGLPTTHGHTHRFCTCSQSSCPRPLVYRLLTDCTHRFCTCSQSSCPQSPGLPTTHGLHSQVLHVALSPPVLVPWSTDYSRTALTGSARAALSPPVLSPLYRSTDYSRTALTGSARALSPPVLVPYRSTDYSRTALTGSARCSQSSCPRPLVYRLLTDCTHRFCTCSQSSCPRPLVYRLLTDCTHRFLTVWKAA